VAREVPGGRVTMADSTIPPPDREQRLHEVIADYLAAVDAGQAPQRQEFLACHAEFGQELTAFLADYGRVHRVAAPLPGESAALGPGPEVRYFGDYELVEQLAHSGMGVVYRARQVSLNRPVALKMILAGPFASLGDVRRFRAEAETTASLDHPNIVP